MEKISSKSVAIRNSKKVGKAEKGTVTIRQRGNSFEARIRLELKKGKKGEMEILDYQDQVQQKKLQEHDWHNLL